MFAKAERMFYCYYQYLMDSEITTKIKGPKNEPDSDDEYRVENASDQFLNDNFLGKPDIASKEIVQDYFKFFLSLNDQITDNNARKDFLSKINNIIDQTQTEID